MNDAAFLDRNDALSHLRDEFIRPVGKNGAPVAYLAGNSLGLMPKRSRQLVIEELDRWGAFAVDGHFRGDRPWFSYHDLLRDSGARLVGAKPGEVVAMGSLTANLHMLMVSFYRPNKERFRIVVEASAFPSDRYAVQSQAAFHGFDPKSAVVELAPRSGEDLLRTEDVQAFFAREGDSVALVLMGGVNFYSGQAYDLAVITQAAHNAGAVVGFDLAHAAGNLPLQLHDLDVDFAAWCSYKYLNAGPGSVAMAFVHDKHANRPELPRFAGWWGNDPTTRFEMRHDFEPQSGAAGWQLSNAPVLSSAALLGSLELFDKAGMAALREKSVALTSYLLSILDAAPQKNFKVLTPRDATARGCQISLRVQGDPSVINDKLEEQGIVCDVRRPDVIRIAPVPLYTSFADVERFARAFLSIVG